MKHVVKVQLIAFHSQLLTGLVRFAQSFRDYFDAGQHTNAFAGDQKHSH